jgi:hypothetical protein
MAKKGEPTAERRKGPEMPSEDYEERIRYLAYSFWETAGCPDGRPLDFWLAAEKAIHAADAEKSRWPS